MVYTIIETVEIMRGRGHHQLEMALQLFAKPVAGLALCWLPFPLAQAVIAKQPMVLFGGLPNSQH
jgi:hypothetical protein